MEFFEGNFTEYEEYKKRTLGADALEPKRIKYKRIKAKRQLRLPFYVCSLSPWIPSNMVMPP